MPWKHSCRKSVKQIGFPGAAKQMVSFLFIHKWSLLFQEGDGDNGCWCCHWDLPEQRATQKGSVRWPPGEQTCSHGEEILIYKNAGSITTNQGSTEYWKSVLQSVLRRPSNPALTTVAMGVVIQHWLLRGILFKGWGHSMKTTLKHHFLDKFYEPQSILTSPT